MRVWNGKLEARPGFEPGMEVLQTSALPLGYQATTNGDIQQIDGIEEIINPIDLLDLLQEPDRPKQNLTQEIHFRSEPR